MARAFPVSPQNDYGASPPGGDWQALRGELVALLDQVEGQYGRRAGDDAALAGFAQRMRDLRYQVAEVPPDDRRREALRSVKRQMDRFNERGEPESVPHADNVLQSAIQQIRARTGGASLDPQQPRMAPQPPPPQQHMPMPPPSPAPRFDEMAQAMSGLSARLEHLEAELRAQRGNAAQVREIADQVSQLSHVVELVAGAVGETGQVKRLEGQIAGLAQLISQAPKVDLSQVNERLDAVSATVDRLADLQVQQIEHVVREAAAGPDKDAETAKGIRAIESSVRNIYDRMDALEHSVAMPPAALEQISEAMGQISARLNGDNVKPERLLGLVDALNGRLNELEDRGDALGGLRGDIEGLRLTILGALEPRFTVIETRLGALDERLQVRAAETPGVAQLEAQVRQLVARMDQTGEQLSELGRLYNSAEDRRPAPDFETLANLAATRTFDAISRRDAATPPPDLEALAARAATRTFEAMSRNQPPAPDFDALADLVAGRTAAALARQPQPPAPAGPDLDALADMVAGRTVSAMARQPQAAAPDLEALVERAAAKAGAAVARVTAPASSETALGEIEGRLTRLVEGISRARPPEGLAGMQDGIGRVEERLRRLEASLLSRPEAPSAAPRPMAEPAQMSAPAPSPARASAAAPARRTPPAAAEPDAMPRDPAAEAPLKEFGFPDMGPVRAALEAKNGPRKLHPGIDKSTDDAETPGPGAATDSVDAARKTAAMPAVPGAASFDPAVIPRPPRPESSLDAAVDAAFNPPPMPPAPAASGAPEAPASSRNTFIEAARRAAQRQNPQRAQIDASSLIGRALGRFQPGTPAEKPAAPTTAAAPVKPMPVPPAGNAPQAGKAKALSKFLVRKPAPPNDAARAAGPMEPVAPTMPAAAPAAASLTVEPAERRDAVQESFLLRHRRAILLAASVIAVSFMALNLVMQRLASNDNTAPASATTQSPAPAPAAPTAMQPSAAPSAPAASPAPASVTPGPAVAPKPVSDIAPSAPRALPMVTKAAAPGPRMISMTDPMTTASIGPALSFAPAGSASMMPAPLAAKAAVPPAAAPSPAVQVASVPANAVANPATALDTNPAAPVATADPAAAPASGAAAPAATEVASVDPSAPVAMDSPVKVELPPDSVGPLDLRQAAANGDARAQFEIAAIYSEGRAVPQDFKQAAVWYERAAAQGFGPAQYRLGNLYENGKGVDKDLEQARLWYQRAAEGGNRMAMHNLAALYAGGQFGKQDFASAAEWFERAADLGMKDSQFNLGMLYARGLGVTQNLETSYKWFAVAATGGDAEAGKARDDMARSLDAEAVKRVAAEVAAWKPAEVNLAANFAPIGTWEKNFNPGPTVTSKDVVMKVQVALMRLGFDVGTPDGHAGPKTAVAIKAFEQGTGMTEVGAINPRLLAVLGSQPV